MMHSPPHLTPVGQAGQMKQMFAWEFSQGLIQEAKTVSTPEQIRPGLGGQPHISLRLWFTNTESHRVGKVKAFSIFKVGILSTSNVRLYQLSRGDNGELQYC